MDKLAFRTGLKFGVAGLLAIHLSLVLRLGQPTWALFTVFVLMIAPYVGEIAEKAVFRVIGTVVGGALGYLVLDSLQQEPPLFLLVVGLLVTFCVAMFGQKHAPYAFLLTGLTAVVVITDGFGDPAFSWRIALVRAEEIILGIVVVMLVSLLLWPRYARVEFRNRMTEAFLDLAASFDEHRPVLHGSVSAEDRARVATFPLRLTGLRTLLQYGARESRYFSARIDVYSEIVSGISRIAGAIRTLGEPLPAQSFYRGKVDAELIALHAALSTALRNLAAAAERNDAPDRSDLPKAYAKFEEKVRSLRARADAAEVSSEEALVFGVHALALDEIIRLVGQLHGFLDRLDAPPPRAVGAGTTPQSFVPPTLAIRTGLKAAVAVGSSLILLDWLDPPGGQLMVLGAFIFTVFSPLSPGGGGDRRALHLAALYSLVTAGACLALLVAAPLFSSYAVLNVFLFTALFLWGSRFRLGSGIGMPHQIAMLLTVGVLGLNAQQPVEFQQIADIFFGLTLALVISALVQRLLWPVLPQHVLRDRLVEFVGHCRVLSTVGVPGTPLADRIRMALVPAECRTALANLPAAGTPALESYLESLRQVASDLFACAGLLRPILPGELAGEGHALLDRLASAITANLAEQHASLAENRPPKSDRSKLTNLLAEWREWSLRVRSWIFSADAPFPDAVRLMGYTGRYEQLTRHLLAADDNLRRIDLPATTADYAL